MPDDGENLGKVRTIIQRVEKERLYKGKGGEIMRAGVCHLIHSISTSKIKLEEKLSHELLKTMIENMKHPNPDIQDESAKALHTYCNTYFGGSVTKEEMNLTKTNPIIVDLDKLFKPSMNDMNIAVTRGYNMAFGVYSKELLKYFYPGIVDVLLANCVPKGTDGDDAE